MENPVTLGTLFCT